MNFISSTRYNLSDIDGFNNLINGKDTNDLEVLKLQKMEARTPYKSSYKIIKYDKKLLHDGLVSSYGLCRSVIINSYNKVVGFSPPKSIKSVDFMKKYNENTDGVVAEEFIEGTMINVFWDDSIGLEGSWEISTRNTIGATSSFYKNEKSITFRDMFLEAQQETKLDFSLLEKEYCYSFVVQHPKNRIVVPFKRPKLYLVAVYSIHTENDTISVNVHDSHKFKELFSSTLVKFTEIYNFDNYSDLIERYASMNTPYNILGVVLYNKLTGERTKIRNPVYEEVRNLKGNQPKLQYQYLCLRQQGKVGEFLKFYPENKKEFSEFRDKVHLFTNTLFSNYVSCYIKKEKPLKEFDQQYRTHMFLIHQKFVNELRENKQFITSTIVKNYVNEIHPSLLMHCVNFRLKKNEDNIAVENEN